MNHPGRTATRKTSRVVRYGDLGARALITFGGIGTILAVLLVCVFLVWVVTPLLQRGELRAEGKVALADFPARAGSDDETPLHVGVDAYRFVGWRLLADGRAAPFVASEDVRRTANSALAPVQVFDPAATTVVAVHGNRVLAGRKDGSLAFAEVEFSADSLTTAGVPEAVRGIPVGAAALAGDAVYARTGEGDFRRQRLSVTEEEPRALEGTSAAVVRADFSVAPSGRYAAAVTADGVLHLVSVRTRHSLIDDTEIVTFDGGLTPLATLATELPPGLPDHLLLSGTGDEALLLWNDGTLVRLDARDFGNPRVAEVLDVLPEQGVRVSSVGWLIGKATLLVGDQNGAVSCWFSTKTDDDVSRLERVRVFAPATPSPVVSLAASERTRLFVAGRADGSLTVVQATSGKEVASARTHDGRPPLAAVFAPKEDGVLAVTSAGATSFALEAGHPEVTLASVFLPVWFEGYSRPAHVWQSTSGSDDFEPKFGLWPLLFGTLKATFYCLLFGVPIALLAALYTSEFLHPRVRARIKPAIELMASLPSVVLGFLAALVFAPVVETYIADLIAFFVLYPLFLLAAAHLLQFLPPGLRARGERWRLAGAAAVMPIAIAASLGTGPAVEAVLFGGDLKTWLATGRGSAFGGWLLLTIPLGAFCGGLLLARLGPLTRVPLPLRGVSWLALAGGLAAAFAGSLTFAGLDVRGGLLGTYDQRNALVVGLVMGFAVVPIVYTIAEDALSAVPEHLRAASLGAGATPWQTAIRIVLPTAMSGIFSAVMVGLGRAVGETMIVLMAAGNTAVLDLNVFNGFRTLSANIATELPEAVRNSTHYRMLYLAALLLFVLTFVLNTAAELVRQRFRKRAYQL